ncbi:MAG TPA: class IV adenylate cyclase [Acidobacteria bacterium]|nr:class IV adenylate cyclase [Acidobacteriota bacterium]
MEERPPVEQELKIPVENLEAVRRRLNLAGGRLVKPSRREINVLFDTADGEIARTDRALRLRLVDGRWLLTYKGPPVYHGTIKEREELETGIDSGEVIQAIFRHLGLSPSVRYEKDREVWRVRDLEVALDHTPMGDFVEIEGPAVGLNGAARELGLEPGHALRGSYVTLWERYRTEHPELDLPHDMVFPR